MRTLVSAMVALSLVGCASAPSGAGVADAPQVVDATADLPVDVPPIAGALMDVGTGVMGWTDLPTQDARMELVHGPQGGFHVLARVRFTGFDPDVQVRFVLTPAEAPDGPPMNDTQPLHRLDRRGLTRSDGDGYESSSAELVVFATVHEPAEVVGRRFRLRAYVEEVRTGRTLAASREMTVVDDVP